MPWWFPFYYLIKLFGSGGRNEAGGIAKKFKWKEEPKKEEDW